MKKFCVGVNGSIDEIKNLVNNIDSIYSIFTSDFVKNTTGGRKGEIIRNLDQINEIADFLNKKKLTIS